MPELINKGRFSIKVLLVAAMGWALLWILPWGRWTAVQGSPYAVFPVDMIRLGVAVLAFIIPGILLYVIVRNSEDSSAGMAGILPIGFAFSVMIIGVIGLVGRLAGWSFQLVCGLFALTGMVELALLYFSGSKINLSLGSLSGAIHSALTNPPLVLALALSVLLTFHDKLFFIDDTSYLAYLTHWQYADHLDFQNIVYRINIVESVRFWLAMYPMGQALISNLSGVPGVLLLGSYLELFLVPLAILTSFWLARRLGLSRVAAGFSVLIQISIYAWMQGDQFPVGMWFYRNMTEDKVTATFILAPVFLVFVLSFILAPGKRRLFFVLLSGIGLALTHPVSLFYACAIAVGLTVVSLIVKRSSWRELGAMVIVSVCLMIPYLAIRLLDAPSAAEIPFDAESAVTTYEIGKYTNVVNGLFYGLNQEVLKFFDIPLAGTANTVYQLFRWTPAFLSILAGLLAVPILRRGPFYWYVFCCAFLVACATVPYTGWLLGFFVSARLISRTAWFLPVGLGSVLILQQIRGLPAASQLRNGRRTVVAGLLACFVFASPFLAYSAFSRAGYYFTTLDYYRQLAQVGAFIDGDTEGPVIVLAEDYWDIQMLPGVSANARLISFREEVDINLHSYFLSLDDVYERRYASNTIRSLDPAIPPEERCLLLDKYDVQYMLVKSTDAGVFQDLVEGCSRRAEKAFRTQDMVLFELK